MAQYKCSSPRQYVHGSFMINRESPDFGLCLSTTAQNEHCAILPAIVRIIVSELRHTSKAGGLLHCSFLVS